MGNISTKQIQKGIPYDILKHQIRPFDLIFFKSGHLIPCIESTENCNPHSINFSHVGIVVSRDILDLPVLQHNKLYIYESTISGRCGYNVNTVYGDTCLGVQIRDLDAIVKAYNKPSKNIVAWGHLATNPLDREEINKLSSKFMQLYDELHNLPYDINCFSLLAAVYPCLRSWRPFIESITGTSEWLFCSELVTIVLKYFDILPAYVDPKNVLPIDLAYKEKHDPLPIVIDKLTLISKH